MLNRREFLAGLASTSTGAILAKALGDEPLQPIEPEPFYTRFFRTIEMTGRVTGESAVINLVTAEDLNEELWIRVRSMRNGRDFPHPPFLSRIVRTSAPRSRVELALAGLQPNQTYSYRIEYATASNPRRWFHFNHISSFCSRKTAGRSFSFCAVADPHWGHPTKVAPGSPRRWTAEQCLRRILEDEPFDFMIDLGDSPYLNWAETESELRDLYFNYRDIMAPITRAMPAYLVLGNHEQEAGFYQRGTDAPDPPRPRNGLSAEQYHQKWASKARLLCIPNPRGDTYPEGGEGAPGYDSLDDWLGEEGPWNEGSPRGNLQNFYAWTWGDALFIVLDPYRYTLVGSITRPNCISQWTLGPTQLQWLEDVLANSTATWKFLFSHHQVGGGLIDAQGCSILEGGASPAYGRGSAVEADRTGAEQAFIHNLMLQHGAQFFVYGHDHVFCHSVKDGINYLCTGRPPHLNHWWHQSGMLNSYGSILDPGQSTPWIDALYAVLGYAKFNVTPNRVTLQWIRTGYSFANDMVPVGQAQRDWIESWAGKQYQVDSAASVTVPMVPTDVDGARTVDGAPVPWFYQPPTGAQYYEQPNPVRPEDYTDSIIPLNDFPDPIAVVDTVPELVYEVSFDI